MMKLQDLINQLTTLLSEEDDIEVRVYCDDCCNTYTIFNIVVESDDIDNKRIVVLEA